MAWCKIPNGVVSDFAGRPIKRQVLDSNLEPVFEPIVCTVKECGFKQTNLREFNEHIAIEHGMAEMATRVKAVTEDATAARLLRELLMVLAQPATGPTPSRLALARRPNDSHQSQEVWRRVSIAITQNAPEIHLKQDQYNWLKDLLSRKVPLAASLSEIKALRDEGIVPESVADYAWGSSGDAVAQALLVPEDRRKEDPDPEDPDAKE